ncbi:unnamed protein product [Phaedon cochleariae]|uniref:Epoxide hydrolase N-terminal domain-containing protein n=1 Tax=Phaedon cochleariae TaxID=80249 RepID=A0A9N9SP20_PHACE|nr:unnamed protein product [Phaedon cochleariae]
MAVAVTITALIVLGTAVVIFMKVQPLLEVPPVPKLEETWWGPVQLGKSIDTSIKPFQVNVSDEVNAMNYEKHRKDKLNNYFAASSTLPSQPPLEEAKQHYGMNTDLLQNITEFWKTKYDWRERETFLNRYPHFKVNVQGLNIHYIHVKPAPEQTSKGVRVLPLLLLHGWPESVSQFNGIIPLLTTAQKGTDFVFEVIAPSLPGFGFSDAAVRPGLGAIQMAIVMKNLMEMIKSLLSKSQANFNANKTQACLFSRKADLTLPNISLPGVTIPLKTYISMLGITISNNLSWENHVTPIAKSASEKLGFLFRARSYLTSRQLLMIYKAQIRPVLEYYSHIWSAAPKHTLKLLVSVQKRAIRLVGDASLTNSLTSLEHRFAPLSGQFGDLQNISFPSLVHPKNSEALEHIAKEGVPRGL